MNLGELISSHGYWVLALGALLEGETVLALAGFAAHRGYLSFPVVVAVAAAAGFCGDTFYFWLGRRHGDDVLARFPSLARRADRIQRLIERYHEGVIVGVRFAYGLRIAGPILIGTSNVAAWRFVAFNALGALIWATLIAGLGWVFGEAIQRALGELRHIEMWLFTALIAIGTGLWLVRRGRSRPR
jgi:membrane protein DedA with SNARE-associated domain